MPNARPDAVPFLFSELRQCAALSKWRNKRAKMQVAIRVSLAVCLLLYVTIAVAGTTAFGRSVAANILVSLSSARGRALLPAGLVSGVMGAMSVVMICVFPLNAYGLRVGLHAMATGGGAETAARRWLGALVLTGASTAIAALVDDLGALFQLIGATTGVTIMFLLPSALIIRIATFATSGATPAPSPYVPPLLAEEAPSEQLVPRRLDLETAAVAEPAAATVSTGDAPGASVLAPAALFVSGLSVGVCGTVAVFL